MAAKKTAVKPPPAAKPAPKKTAAAKAPAKAPAPAPKKPAPAAAAAPKKPAPPVVITPKAPAPPVVITPKAPAPPVVIALKKPAAKRTGNAAIAFKSAGFRLTVINELLDLGHFADAFEEAQESSEKVEDYEIDPRVQKFVDGLVLTEELLEQVVKIGPDGGDEIYAALVPVWDGEDDRFDIGTLDDVHLLPNLERVSLYAMVSEGIDLTPLRDVATLTHVNINLSKGWAKGWPVLDELAARGVEVTRS
jgi:hypothetical protein